MTLQRVSQCLPAMVKCRLDHPVKDYIITAKAGPPVAFQTDDGGLNPGGWMEDLGWYPEQVFNIIPCLQEYCKNAIGLGSVGGPDPVCHLLLQHAYYLVYDLPVLKDSEEDLAGNIVGKVTDDSSRFDQEWSDIIF